MLMGVLALLAVLSVPLTGKDLRRLGGLRVRAAWLLPLGLGLQVLVINLVPDAPRVLTVGTHLATYLLAAVFLALNRAVPGLLVLAAGAALNGVTIFVNGGTLPASAEALRFAGLAPDPADFTNSGVLEQPRLALLGDVFALPAGLPFANVFSIGDVVILVGVTLALHRTCAAPSPSLDPLLLTQRQSLIDELDRVVRALHDAGERNDALATELARRAQRPVLPAQRDLDGVPGPPERASAPR